jgi:hypothetical protein
LLEDGLLTLAQIVVGALQGGVELRLTRGECDVLAQLQKEFAFAAAERIGRTTRGDQHAEHTAFGTQRRDHERLQPTSREPRREGKCRPADILLVHERAAHTA